jgi:hypothetical protein
MSKHIRSKCFRINIQSQELEFLLTIIKNDFGIIIFTNGRGEIYIYLKYIINYTGVLKFVNSEFRAW